MAALEYVTVTGTVGAIVVDYTDADTHPDEQVVTAFVDIFPRVPVGTVLWCPTLTPPRGLALAPMRCRLDGSQGGQLKTIVGGPVELLACNAALPISELIYDFVFSEVRYNKRPQSIAPFGLRMPTAAATIDLSSPSLERLPAAPSLKPL